MPTAFIVMNPLQMVSTSLWLMTRKVNNISLPILIRMRSSDFKTLSRYLNLHSLATADVRLWMHKRPYSRCSSVKATQNRINCWVTLLMLVSYKVAELSPKKNQMLIKAINRVGLNRLLVTSILHFSLCPSNRTATGVSQLGSTAN